MLPYESRASALTGRFEPESGGVDGVFIVACADIRSNACTVVAAAAVGVSDEEAGCVACLKEVEREGNEGQ